MYVYSFASAFRMGGGGVGLCLLINYIPEGSNLIWDIMFLRTIFGMDFLK